MLLDKKVRVIPHPLPVESLYRVIVRDKRYPENNSDTTSKHDLRSALRTLNGIQVTESENHPHWKNLRKEGFRGDVGGDFTMTKRYCMTGNSYPQLVSGSELSAPTVEYPLGSRTTTGIYQGPVLPKGASLLPWPTTAPSSESQLRALGTKAIARCSPSNPSVDLSVTVGELVKDGIPRLLGSTLGRWRSLNNQERRRAIGSEYLNVEFGWKPLVNDLRDFSHAIVSSDEILSQYERDSGRLVRRSYDFPELIETDIKPYGSKSSPWTSPSSSLLYNTSQINLGQVVRTEVRATRQWFRGAFSYYVPPADGLRNSMAREVILARKLLGVSLTPDVLWNLAPWSWMFDWFGNAGDVIRNWTNWAIDNQVLMYGYLMEHKVTIWTYTFTGPTGYKAGSVQPSDIILVSESKVRRKATPYGFGLSWSGFSPRQLSILTALGLTKS